MTPKPKRIIGQPRPGESSSVPAGSCTARDSKRRHPQGQGPTPLAAVPVAAFCVHAQLCSLDGSRTGGLRGNGNHDVFPKPSAKARCCNYAKHNRTPCLPWGGGTPAWRCWRAVQPGMPRRCLACAAVGPWPASSCSAPRGPSPRRMTSPGPGQPRPQPAARRARRAARRRPRTAPPRAPRRSPRPAARRPPRPSGGGGRGSSTPRS